MKNMNNIELFSLYTAKILKELYDSFPIPINIDQHKMITDCLQFDKHEELQNLKHKNVIGNLLNETGKISNIEKHLQNQEEYSVLENERGEEIRYQTNIFNSTLEFLISENLIRNPESGGYVLTAKAFSHLNKNFVNGKLNDEESSYIKTIKNIFSRTAGATEKIGIGVAVKVIPSLLGIS